MHILNPKRLKQIGLTVFYFQSIFIGCNALDYDSHGSFLSKQNQIDIVNSKFDPIPAIGLRRHKFQFRPHIHKKHEENNNKLDLLTTQKNKTQADVNPIVASRHLLEHDDNLLDNSNFQCHICSPDEFCFDNHAYACPPHSLSTDLADDISECFCVPSYYQSDEPFSAGGVCLPCEQNHYCVGGTKLTQTACPANSESSAFSTIVTDCFCSVGYTAGARILDDHSDWCVPCDLGFYKNTIGNGVCTACAQNLYQNDYAQTSCKTCPENTVSLLASKSIFACVSNIGTFGHAGSAATLCAPGTYANEINMTTCTPCPVSSYFEESGATDQNQCKQCPQNSNIYDSYLDNEIHDSNILHGTSILQCLCDSGYTGTISLNSADEPENPVCAACLAGSFKSIPGETPCNTCPINTYAPSASSLCIDCVGNSTTKNLDNRPDSSHCICNAGYEAMILGMQTETLSAFHIATDPITSVDFCSPCARGYHKSLNSAPVHTACLACDGGYFTDNLASVECKTCLEGTYTTTSASTTCKNCGNNEFSSTASSSIASCICLGGFSRNFGGVDDIAQTINDDLNADGNADCLPCVPGSYRVFETDDTKCLQCTDGFTSAEASAHAYNCIECQANNYVAMTQQGRFCRNCVTDSSSPALSLGLDNCICDSGYAYTQDETAITSLTNENDAIVLESLTSCTYCEEGTFKPLAENDICNVCPSGKYGTDPPTAIMRRLLQDASTWGILETESCQPSPVDYYTVLDASGVQIIVKCPTNSSSPAGSQDLTACLCDPGFSFVSDNTACKACSPGKFKAITADTQCLFCAAGSFQFDQASTSCISCGLHAITIGDGNIFSDACLCNAGYHLPQVPMNTIAPTCVKCINGSYTLSANRDTSCQTCGASSFLATTSTTGTATCLACMQHSTATYSAFGTDGCVCNAGYKRVGNNADPNDISGIECAQCAANTYCPTQTLQISCGPNSVSVAGSSSISACKCNAGYFGVDGQCSKCWANHYCEFDSNTPTACHGNSTTNGILGATNQSFCICIPGMYDYGVANGQEPSCKICDQDSYCFGDDLLVCPRNSSAPRKSGSLDSCVCDPGLILASEDKNGVNTPVCASCDSSMVCHGENEFEYCAPNASNYHSRCVCKAGMFCNSAHAATLPWDSCSIKAEIEYWTQQLGEELITKKIWEQINATTCSPVQIGHYASNNQLISCPNHETSLPSSDDESDCRCDRGYYRDASGDCVICPLDKICPGGRYDDIQLALRNGLVEENELESSRNVLDFGNNLITISTGTFSMDDVICSPGYFRTSKYDRCKLCPLHYFCPDESSMPNLPNVVACLLNEVTEDIGSTSNLDCVCDSGFKTGPLGDTMACLPCEIGERCSAGQVVEAQCHYLKRIPNEDHTKCVCDVGHGEFLLKCEICPPGSVKNYIGDFECDYCSTNEYSLNNTHCAPCPANSFSRPGSSQCTCLDNYVMIDGQCVLCPQNHYFVKNAWVEVSPLYPAGIGPACLSCPLQSTSEYSADRVIGSTACSCSAGSIVHPRLPAGLYLSNFTNATGVNMHLTCQACEPDQYENEGACFNCPANSTSAEASTSISQCICPAYNESLATCLQQRVDYSCGGVCEKTLQSCTECEVGKFKPAFSETGNTDECAVCSTSKYQELTGQTACIACANHEKHYLFGSSNRSDCKCIAGFERRQGNEFCSACHHGQFKATDVSDHLCSLCELGKFQEKQNATACTSCAYATYSLERFANARLHELFGNEHTLHHHDHELLVDLINNTIHPVLLSNSTHELGSISVLQCQCPLGFEPIDDLSTINDHFNPDSPLPAQKCTACPVGKFNSEIGLHMCDFCGTVLADYGQSYVDTYGRPDQTGAYSVAHCLGCPKHSGQEAHLIGHDGLTQDSIDKCLCFPGFSSFDSNVGCSNCSDYKIQPIYSRNDCQYCDAGNYFLRSNLECEICSVVDAHGGDNHLGIVINSVDDNFLWASSEADCSCKLGFERLDNTCKKCEIGFFRNDNLTRLCEECIVDEYQDVTGQLQCKQCPANSFTYGLTASDDIIDCVCAPGYESLSELGVCNLCAAGTFRTNRTSNFIEIDGTQHATSCNICPENHFCIEGSVVPVACPPNEVSLPGSESLDDCKCPVGRGRNNAIDEVYSPTAANRCELCDHGFYSDTVRNYACNQCPTDKNTSVLGSENLASCKCVAGTGVSEATVLSSLEDVNACVSCTDGFFSTGGLNIKCVFCGWGAVTEPELRATSGDQCQCNAEVGLKHRPY